MLEPLLTINAIICSSAPTWFRNYKNRGSGGREGKVNWTIKTDKLLGFSLQIKTETYNLECTEIFAEGAEKRD